jgi:hypothetical protein
MKASKWTLILIGFVAILMAGQNAWADGKRDRRGHGGKAYKAEKYHGGSGYHHKKPQHGGHAYNHHKRPRHPQVHQYHRRPHRRPEPRPNYHEHHRRPPHHHHENTGGYLFSASILDPAFALSIITGERW